ncbi:SMEK domain-containing protein [Serratia rhizosphaerae]
MIKSMEYITNISNGLAYLSRCVEARSSLNLNDINIHSENFYKDLFNLIYDYNLKNLNSINQNIASIDLADEEKKLCIQVTCTNTIEKIKSTVDKFIKENLHEQYETLQVLILTKKKKYKTIEYGKDGIYKFNIKSGVIDYRDVLRHIQNLTSEKQFEVKCFLEKELNLKETDNTPKEVKTLMHMIKILSNDDHPNAGNGFAEKPDPENKIYKRFSEHSSTIIEKYTSLAPMYGDILQCIRNESDIGLIKQKKMEIFLEKQSNEFLIAEHNNPLLALEKLKIFYCNKVSLIDNEYDDSAIEFFLVDNLFRCTVFPNKAIA